MHTCLLLHPHAQCLSAHFFNPKSQIWRWQTKVPDGHSLQPRGSPCSWGRGGESQLWCWGRRWTSPVAPEAITTSIRMDAACFGAQMEGTSFTHEPGTGGSECSKLGQPSPTSRQRIGTDDLSVSSLAPFLTLVSLVASHRSWGSPRQHEFNFKSFITFPVILRLTFVVSAILKKDLRKNQGLDIQHKTPEEQEQGLRGPGPWPQKNRLYPNVSWADKYDEDTEPGSKPPYKKTIIGVPLRDMSPFLQSSAPQISTASGLGQAPSGGCEADWASLLYAVVSEMTTLRGSGIGGATRELSLGQPPSTTRGGACSPAAPH